MNKASGKMQQGRKQAPPAVIASDANGLSYGGERSPNEPPCRSYRFPQRDEPQDQTCFLSSAPDDAGAHTGALRDIVKAAVELAELNALQNPDEEVDDTQHDPLVFLQSKERDMVMCGRLHGLISTTCRGKSNSEEED